MSIKHQGQSKAFTFFTKVFFFFYSVYYFTTFSCCLLVNYPADQLSMNTRRSIKMIEEVQTISVLKRYAQKLF